jgi:long-chain acyl-CoA synthetase
MTFSPHCGGANPRAVLWQDEFGQWQPISSDQIYQRVRALAEAFLGWGREKGRPHCADRREPLGVGGDGLCLAGHWRCECAHLSHADRRAGGRAGARRGLPDCRGVKPQQFDKLNAVRAQTELERIVIMDSASPPEGAIAFSAAGRSGCAREASATRSSTRWCGQWSRRTWPR